MVLNLHHFDVSGSVVADLFVRRVRRGPASVASDNLGDSTELLKNCFGTPKTPAAKRYPTD